MTNLEIFFMVMFFATLIIAIIAIINCVKIDKAHNNIEMKLLDEAMFANTERLKLLTEISMLETQLNETKEELEEELPNQSDGLILYHTELNHSNFKELSVYAKVLYMYMKDFAYNSKAFFNNESFKYSVRLVKDILDCSLQKANDTIHELEQKGFIERQNNSKHSRQTSEWKFSSKWQEEIKE